MKIIAKKTIFHSSIYTYPHGNRKPMEQDWSLCTDQELIPKYIGK